MVHRCPITMTQLFKENQVCRRPAVGLFSQLFHLRHGAAHPITVITHQARSLVQILLLAVYPGTSHFTQFWLAECDTKGAILNSLGPLQLKHISATRRRDMLAHWCVPASPCRHRLLGRMRLNQPSLANTMIGEIGGRVKRRQEGKCSRVWGWGVPSVNRCWEIGGEARIQHLHPS